MFQQIQQSKLAVLAKQKEELLAKRRSERQRFNNIHLELDSLTPPTKTSFNFFEKNVTKRKEYQSYQKYNSLQQELVAEEGKLAESTIERDLAKIETSIGALQDCQTIYDLDMSPIEAMHFLEERGITPVLDESDMVSTEHPRDYSSKSSLLAVHKTFHTPKNNQIITTKQAGGTYKETVTINGKEMSYSYPAEIDSVHLALNNQVTSHEMGNWDACPVAIFMPLKDIESKSLGAVEAEDTFTIGNLDLSKSNNSWIMCPENQIEEMKQNNPNCHIIGYKGTRALEYATPFVTQLGYRAENITKNGWLDDVSSQQFSQLRQKEQLPYGKHANTPFYTDLKFLESMNRAVGLSTLLRDNHLITNEADVPQVMAQLESQNKGFGKFLESLCVTSAYIGMGRPEGNNAVDIFLTKMKESGFELSATYETLLHNIHTNNLLNCNQSNIGNVLNNLQNVSENEQIAINDFCSEIDGTMDGNSKAFGKLITKSITSSIVASHTKLYGNQLSTNNQSNQHEDVFEM